MQLKYTLNDVILKYDDVAEFYWKFISNDWEYKVKNIKITITLPKTTHKENIQVWGHGPSNGFVKILGTQNILLTMDSIQNESLAARIVFPSDQINSTYHKYQTGNGLETILDKEATVTTQIPKETELKKPKKQIVQFCLSFLLSFYRFNF